MNTKTGEMTPTTLDWRERFRSNFYMFTTEYNVPITWDWQKHLGHGGAATTDAKDLGEKLEAFISQLLESQTAEYVRRVETLRKPEKDHLLDYDDIPTCYACDYDQAIDEVLATINRKDLASYYKLNGDTHFGDAAKILTQKKKDTHAE